MKKQMRTFSGVFLGVALAVGLTALEGIGARADDTIKIGVLEPFTGPWAKNGNESYVAMEIARDMINEKGGVNGKKVVFIRGDAPDPGPPSYLKIRAV